jgi:hypothetical protein
VRAAVQHSGAAGAASRRLATESAEMRERRRLLNDKMRLKLIRARRN